MKHHVYPEEHHMNDINRNYLHEYPGGFTHHPEYDRLPEVIRRTVTPEEYAWMGSKGRDGLVNDLCYPDWEED